MPCESAIRGTARRSNMIDRAVTWPAQTLESRPSFSMTIQHDIQDDFDSLALADDWRMTSDNHAPSIGADLARIPSSRFLPGR